jgi:hypothetical protein
MPTPEIGVLALLFLALAWLLGAESPKHIFFLISGTRGDWYPLGTGALLLLVSFGMQSILCFAPRRRKRAAPYSRNTPRKGKYSLRTLPNTLPTTPTQQKHNAPCP